MRNVFHPSTCAQANGKPRVLINDGFATHESLELLEFCFENNIVLCHLPSHTAHKLQPCDVSVFGPLKAAYREQVDDRYRGGANTVGKEHFTLLYSRARNKAFTPRNIRLGWSRAGLFPFNPEKVLHDIPQPQDEQGHLQGYIQPPLKSPVELLITPITSDGVASLCKRIGQGSHVMDDTSRQQVEKLKHAAQRAIASRDLLSVNNNMLIKQNNESEDCEVVGPASRQDQHLDDRSAKDRARRRPRLGRVRFKQWAWEIIASLCRFEAR